MVWFGLVGLGNMHVTLLKSAIYFEIVHDIVILALSCLKCQILWCIVFKVRTFFNLYIEKKIKYL